MLRLAGAEVIVPARDVDRAGKAVAGLDGVRVAPMDLLDQDSIDAFADSFLADGKPLHILVNSAGIMANPFTLDARGYESQFATNHLGHFQLTTRLCPRCDRPRALASSPCRRAGTGAPTCTSTTRISRIATTSR